MHALQPAHAARRAVTHPLLLLAEVYVLKQLLQCKRPGVGCGAGRALTRHRGPCRFSNAKTHLQQDNLRACGGCFAHDGFRFVLHRPGGLLQAGNRAEIDPFVAQKPTRLAATSRLMAN